MIMHASPTRILWQRVRFVFTFDSLGCAEVPLIDDALADLESCGADMMWGGLHDFSALRAVATVVGGRRVQVG